MNYVCENYEINSLKENRIDKWQIWRLLIMYCFQR